MSRRDIRFGITDGAGNRAATWKCVAPIALSKNDVYLACRELRGVLHVSLHQTGDWHIEFLKKGHYIDRWPRPVEIAPGVTLAFKIVTPSAAVNTPIDRSKTKDVYWIPNAPNGKATEIAILLTSNTTHVTGWPGKQTMNTNLIDSIKLDNGEIVWAVYRTIEIPEFSKAQIKLQYHKGKGPEDLTTKDLRIIVVGNETEGSRVLYDSLVITKKPDRVS